MQLNRARCRYSLELELTRGGGGGGGLLPRKNYQVVFACKGASEALGAVVHLILILVLIDLIIVKKSKVESVN